MDRVHWLWRWIVLSGLVIGTIVAAPEAIAQLSLPAFTFIYSTIGGLVAVLAFYSFSSHHITISNAIVPAAELEFAFRPAAISENVVDLDPLSGLQNHRAFHNHLRFAAEQAASECANLGVLLMDIDNFQFFNDSYGHLVGDEVLKQVSDTLRTAALGFGFENIARFGGDEFAMLVPGFSADYSDSTVLEIQNLFSHLGYRPAGYDWPIPISVSVGIGTFPDDGTKITEVLAVAGENLSRNKNGGSNNEIVHRLRQSIKDVNGAFAMLDALVTAVDNKDRYTRRHSEDVMVYALDIAEILGMDDTSKTSLGIAALLHDVGKIGVPDVILRKPGGLSAQEFEVVKRHPQIGAVIVSAVEGLESTLDAIKYHHERYDGTGYPNGLESDSIPLTARIMAVADSYSAMTTDRPYRKGMTTGEALRVLHEGSGLQWDSHIVQAFLSTKMSKAA